MAIYRRRKTKTLKCKGCGRQFTYSSGGYGDVPTRSYKETINFVRDIANAGIKCPYCGFENKEEVRE